MISPEELKLPDYVKQDVLDKCNMRYKETCDLEKSLDKLDVLYMTRIQQERFTDKSEYERLKDSYILTEEKMQSAKSDMIVLHPLPRVNEISVKVDADKRACYFKQVANGKYVRMALILKLLKDKNFIERRLGDDVILNKHVCKNPRCITQTEQELDQAVRLVDKEKEIYRCVYCDKQV